MISTKTMKKVFLFTIILVLLVGVVNASDNSDNNTATNNQIQKTTDAHDYMISNKQTQQIKKNNTKANTKTANTNQIRKATKISVNYIPNTHYTDKVKISGKLSTKDNKELYGRPVTLNINGKKYTAKTDINGAYTYNYKTSIPGKNNITVSYVGNTYYSQAKNNRTFKVTRMPTRLDITGYDGYTYGNPSVVRGEFNNVNNKILPNTKLNVYINGVKKTTKTDSNGMFEYHYTMKTVGKNTITVQFVGNNKYVGAKDTLSYNVDKQKTKITLLKPGYDKTSNKINIGGYLEDNNYNILKKTPVTISVSGKNYKTTTDNSGWYELSVKPTKEATNVITVSYEGNKYNKKSSDKVSIYVPISKKASKITMDYISGVKVGNYVYITGSVTDNNYNALEYVDVVLNINGKRYSTQTDAYGYYYYSYKTTKYGKNKIIAKFKGNSRYKSSNTTRSFTVNRISTTITVRDIGNPIKGDEFVVYGYLYDEYGTDLNQNVKITINNEVFRPKTQSGMYYIWYKTKKVGTNKITAYYAGNSIYKPAKIVKTFNVQKANLVFGDVIHKGSKNFVHRNCGGHILYSGNSGTCAKCGAGFYKDERIR